MPGRWSGTAWRLDARLCLFGCRREWMFGRSLRLRGRIVQRDWIEQMRSFHWMSGRWGWISEQIWFRPKFALCSRQWRREDRNGGDLSNWKIVSNVMHTVRRQLHELERRFPGKNVERLQRREWRLDERREWDTYLVLASLPHAHSDVVFLATCPHFPQSNVLVDTTCQETAAFRIPKTKTGHFALVSRRQLEKFGSNVKVMQYHA